MTENTNEVQVDTDLFERIMMRLDLRAPNRRAMESVANMTSQHFDVEGSTAPYECIVDSATGVGKTYVLAALLEYFAGNDRPARNFLLLAPGRTIRDKSVQNFTAGNRRSLTGAMHSRPFLITADNFNSPATATAMNDDTITKLYVFTVQALTSEAGEGRATHDFTEGLGGSFYRWLSQREDLVIFADEHHCYRGPGFSKTIRELNPRLVVGLTATPHKSDENLVVYRYPLAKAIEDQHVKTPVLVARKDDRHDERTKLLDGVTLLRYKEQILHAYCSDNDLPNVNPVMLVIAKNIDEANEFQHILDSENFDNGAWIDKTLLVHSKLTGDEKEKALAALDAVENPDSPVRIIISVGMLKEGWDVKNVYVIASMRASVSDVLTEQTLGRGMRLPFGSYTGDEMLDTLEVLAHEKYETLLAKRESLNEKFIDHEVLAEIRKDAAGRLVARKKVRETPGAVITPPVEPTDKTAVADDSDAGSTLNGGVVDAEELLERHRKLAEEVGTDVWRKHLPLTNREQIAIPYIEPVVREAHVSLNQVLDKTPFIKLGNTLTTEADDDLRRTRLKAKDGKIEGVKAESIKSQTFDIPLATSRASLVASVMNTKDVQRREAEFGAAERIVDLVIDAMGNKAALHLSAYLERCARRLSSEVSKQLKEVRSGYVTYESEVRLNKLNKGRSTDKKHKSEHTENFMKSSAYNGWTNNLYEYAWFDTKPEYKAAIAIDDGKSVVVWARLHINDIPISWTSEGRNYNPDFVVIEKIDGKQICWLVETKANKDMEIAEVVAKRRAAKTWANTVNTSKVVKGEWKYLLLSEDDVNDAGEDWEQMKGFGS